MHIGYFVSALFGWIYFCAWSLSFWPQTLLNYRRKSTQGLSTDFLCLNILGFTCYLAWNVFLFSSPTIRREYQRLHNGKNPSVDPNDVAFAAHAFVMSAFTALQALIYRNNHTQKISRTAAILIFVLVLTLILNAAGAYGGTSTWLDFLYVCSYVKLVVSFGKYVPQMLLNYRRKSTVGWSINNILLDSTGGIFSLAQMLLDAGLDDDWKSISGNPSKLILALITLVFDSIFIIQHYILYRHSIIEPFAIEQDETDSSPDERTPLA